MQTPLIKLELKTKPHSVSPIASDFERTWTVFGSFIPETSWTIFLVPSSLRLPFLYTITKESFKRDAMYKGRMKCQGG